MFAIGPKLIGTSEKLPHHHAGAGSTARLTDHFFQTLKDPFELGTIGKLQCLTGKLVAKFTHVSACDFSLSPSPVALQLADEVKMTKLQDNPRVEFSSRFNIQLKQTPIEIKIAFRETLELFLENPLHPQLRNHSLKDKYSGYNSIDITEDWRALFHVRESKTQKVITFHIFGTHIQLYG